VPLLKGNYWINLFLMCEQGIHFYERAERVAEFTVAQNSREVGLVSLNRSWKTG
jgi:lipopolysaccharide transport system ATP-binding protein